MENVTLNRYDVFQGINVALLIIPFLYEDAIYIDRTYAAGIFFL